MAEQALIPKAEAGYRKDSEGTPCSSCGNYISPKACKLVDGTISENGTCDLYAGADSAPPMDLMSFFGGGNG